MKCGFMDNNISQIKLWSLFTYKIFCYLLLVSLVGFLQETDSEIKVSEHVGD